MGLRTRLQAALGDRYRVADEVGRGGMAVVFEATDVALARPVAVKVLRPELATETAARRFAQEARTLANFAHPNVVAVHEVGQGQGLYYFIMDMVKGPTLAQRLEEGPLSYEEARGMGLELLDALAVAHDASIVHRDVKPANIFLTQGRPLLADFGIARPADTDPDLRTVEGQWRGTPRYMAPEVLRGSRATPRSDLYSLGAVLFECVTGRPWEDNEYGKWKDVPARMVPALRGALATDPADRHADAESFRRMLRQRSRVRPRALPLAAGVAVLAAILWIIGPPPGPALPVTVLVAPMTDLTPDGSLAQIADGLTDAITTVVGTSASVRPVGRFTALTLRGQDLDAATLRDQYEVGYVIEGALRSAADGIRISIVLTDARDGLERWSDSFSYSGDEVLERQDDVGWTVLSALEREIGGTRTEPVRRSTTRNLEAFHAYREARQAWTLRDPAGLVRVAIPAFGRAVELDPEWALAWVGLADVYNVVGSYEYGLVPPDVAFETARRASMTALDLAPGLPEALTARASALWNAEGDAAGAESLFRQAIAASPNYAPALQWYAIVLAAQGRHDEALERALEAYHADVLSPVISTQLGRHYYYAGRYREAANQFREAAAQHPDFLTTRLAFGMSLIQEGKLDEALAQFERAQEITQGRHAAPRALIGYVQGRTGDPDQASEALSWIAAIRQGGTYVPFEYDAVVYMGLGEPDRAVEALEAASEAGSNGPMVYHIEPFLDPLHGHPGFEALLDRVGVRRRG